MKSIWQTYDSCARAQYVQAIRALGALSPLFRQKSTDAKDKTTYISSKYQENAFATYFKGIVVDKNNGPYDVMLRSPTSDKWDLVGIKTFLNSSSDMQKIMQFKSVAVTEAWSKWISRGKYQKLIERIAELRNQRLVAAQNLLAGPDRSPESTFENIFYHYLSPAKSGLVYVGESSYSFMDEDNLSFDLPKDRKKVNSILFSDGKNQYKYTPSDSTLYMRFMHRDTFGPGGGIVDEFEVKQIEKPEDILARVLGDGLLPESVVKSESVQKAGVESVAVIQAKDRASKDLLGSVPVVPAVPLEQDVEEALLTDEIVVLPMFRLSKYKDTPPGELNGRSGFNVRCGDPKSKGSKTRRPVHEVEINIPESRKFHEVFPEFFGVNDEGVPISRLNQDEGKRNSIFEDKDDRSFELVLTQPDISMKALLYGDSNKQLMSRYRQGILGEWIISRVFQLPDYEPLTRKRLDEIGVDCIRLTKLGNRRVGMEFIKAGEQDLVHLWPRKVEVFMKLSGMDQSKIDDM